MPRPHCFVPPSCVQNLARGFSVLQRLCLALCIPAAILSGCSGPGLGSRTLTSEQAERSGTPRLVQFPPGVDELVLPSRRCSGYFLVAVMINDRGPFTMLLDTGAGRTVVSQRTAAFFQSDQRAVDIEGSDAQGEAFAINQAIRMRSLKVGDLELGEFDAIAVDLRRISMTLGTPVQGILGYSAFRDVALTLDYPASEVRVSRQPPSPDAETSSLRLLPESIPTVEARIAGRPQRIIIDSGKTGAFALRNLDALPTVQDPIAVSSGVSITGTFVRRAARLSGDIALDNVTFARPIAFDSMASSLMGAEALSSLVVTFDQRSQRLFLRKSTPGPISAQPLRGTGIGFDYEDGLWRVRQLFENAPALASDLQLGDAVIRINGQSLSSFRCFNLRDLYETGESIDFTVLRSGRRASVRVPILPMIP